MSDHINKPIQPPKPYTVAESYQLEDVPFDIEKALIFKSLAGSHSFGMAREESDIDVRGIYVTPLEHIMSLDNDIFFVKNKEGQGDAVFYDLRKFCRMASVSEVNALQMLYSPQEALLEVDECGPQLIENRNLFLSKRVQHGFGGLAFGNAVSALSEDKTGQAKLREKFGYNTKMAMNAVRVIRLGSDLLETGTMQMVRSDNQELRAIRDGNLSKDEFAIISQDKSDKSRIGSQIVGGLMHKESQRLNRALEKTSLPEGPNKSKINELMLRIASSKLEITFNTSLSQSRDEEETRSR